MQHQTLTVRHPDGGIIVPVQYKVEEALAGMRRCLEMASIWRDDANAGRLSWTRWANYWQACAISWASR